MNDLDYIPTTEECEWCSGDGMEPDGSVCINCDGYGFIMLDEDRLVE